MGDGRCGAAGGSGARSGAPAGVALAGRARDRCDGIGSLRRPAPRDRGPVRRPGAGGGRRAVAAEPLRHSGSPPAVGLGAMTTTAIGAAVTHEKHRNCCVTSNESLNTHHDGSASPWSVSRGCNGGVRAGPRRGPVAAGRASELLGARWRLRCPRAPGDGSGLDRRSGRIITCTDILIEYLMGSRWCRVPADRRPTVARPRAGGTRCPSTRRAGDPGRGSARPHGAAHVPHFPRTRTEVETSWRRSIPGRVPRTPEHHRNAPARTGRSSGSVPRWRCCSSSGGSRRRRACARPRPR